MGQNPEQRLCEKAQWSAAIALVKRTIRDHRRVIFNGNGYSAEWEAEAAKRGLPNKKNTPAADVYKRQQ